MNRLVVPLYWSVSWPATRLEAGDVIVTEWDGLGSLVDVEIVRDGVVVDDGTALLDEAAELDALLEAGHGGRVEMSQDGDA